MRREVVNFGINGKQQLPFSSSFTQNPNSQYLIYYLMTKEVRKFIASYFFDISKLWL